MERKSFRKLGGQMLPVAMAVGLAMGMSAQAAVEHGWKEVDGGKYWYENGVKQGTEGRGKEIFDQSANTWCWLDADFGGKLAVDKDVYQESEAGDYAEKPDGTGKWCRYDANGHMVKGWDVTGSGTYYFDARYGAMAKGAKTIDGVDYQFNVETGVLESCSVGMDRRWVTIDGREYWYEGGVRQGYDVNRPDYRGKEIYDPVSKEWYWLDNDQKGAKAVGKDVYQESEAGKYAEKPDGTGKWVRYDANGHMVKGWDTNEKGKYYFDPVYGTMAKGIVTIDGVRQKFNSVTGIYEGEVTGDSSAKSAWYWVKRETLDENDKLTEYAIYENNEKGRTILQVHYSVALDGTKTEKARWEYKYNDAGDMIEYQYTDRANPGANQVNRFEYGYDNGRQVWVKRYSQGKLYLKTVNTYDGEKLLQVDEEQYGESSNETSYFHTEHVYNGSQRTESIKTHKLGGMDQYENYSRIIYKYDNDGNQTLQVSYTWNRQNSNWQESSKTELTYQKVGGGDFVYYNTKTSDYYSKLDENYRPLDEWIYQSGFALEMDGDGRIEKQTQYARNKEILYYEVYEKVSPKESDTMYTERIYQYDKNGKKIGTIKNTYQKYIFE